MVKHLIILVSLFKTEAASFVAFVFLNYIKWDWRFFGSSWWGRDSRKQIGWIVLWIHLILAYIWSIIITLTQA